MDINIEWKITIMVVCPGGGGTPLYSGTGTCHPKGSVFERCYPDFWVAFCKKRNPSQNFGCFSSISNTNQKVQPLRVEKMGFYCDLHR